MKIKRITEDEIEFDDGSYVYSCYSQCCCENNYADFEYLLTYSTFPHSPKAKSVFDLEFDSRLHLKEDEGCGFRFRDKVGNWLCVPCYSEQNGWYSSELDIYHYKNGEIIEHLCANGEIV